jgi:hypothetical protein
MTEFVSSSVKEQEEVVAFVTDHDMESDAAYRILDLAAEVEEIAADATKSTDWGTEPNALEKYRRRIRETGNASSGEK